MELDLSNTLLAGDSGLINHIVGEVKSQGIFDLFRKECIADVDTKVCKVILTSVLFMTVSKLSLNCYSVIPHSLKHNSKYKF